MFEALETRRLFAPLVINGTNGHDTIEIFYDGVFYGVNTDWANTQYYHPAEYDRIVVYGKDGDDLITIDNLASDPAVVHGGDGNDTITTGNGPDTLNGNAGMDALTSGNGNDSLNGGTFKDVLHGTDGMDTLDGGGDADVLDGGDGVDTADYSTRTANLVISLDNLANDGEWHEYDNVIYTENVWGGSGNDRITGNADPNRLEGRAGKDSLYGNNGADLLLGGDGDDYLDGGDDGVVDALWGHAGVDTFKKNTIDALHDRIPGEPIIP